MATSNQIRLAASRPKPRSKDGIDVDRVDAIPDADPEDFPLAREYVRRLGNQHDCSEHCAHGADHDQDVADALQVLIVLGLKDDPIASIEREKRVSAEVKPAPVTEAQQRWRMVSKYLRADHSWMTLAGCRDADRELFFPISYSSEYTEQIAEAKSHCAVCPVRAECLDYAVSTGQTDGIWGGEDPEVRKSLRRRMLRRERAA